MSEIKISLLIPTYNYRIGVNKILNCINNIDYKLRKNIEIIISDDSDKEIIEKEVKDNLLKTFQNFKYIYNTSSLGGANNWNKLISLANGEYFWVLHHDEFWEENKEIFNYILESINDIKPNLIILPLTKQKIFLFNKLKIEVSQKHKIFRNLIIFFIKRPELLLDLNIIGPPSSIIYKKCNLKYDNNLRYLVDVDFYIRLIKKFNSKKILIGKEYFNLISSQNNKNSITKLLKKEKRKISEKEKRIILRKYKYKLDYKENLIIIYSYIILKSFLFISMKLRIKGND